MGWIGMSCAWKNVPTRPLAKGAVEGRREDHDNEGCCRHCRQHQARPPSRDSRPCRCQPWHHCQVPRLTLLGLILVRGVSSLQVEPYETSWDLLSESASGVEMALHRDWGWGGIECCTNESNWRRRWTQLCSDFRIVKGEGIWPRS